MRYRKTVEVDARQFPPLTPGWHQFDPLSLEELADWCGGHVCHLPDGRPYIVVPTPQGEERAWPGDWITKDVQIDLVKLENFEQSHEPVEAPQ